MYLSSIANPYLFIVLPHHHPYRVPFHHLVLKITEVGGQRRRSRPQPKDGIFHGRFAISDGIVEVEVVVVMVVVAFRRCISLLGRFLDFGRQAGVFGLVPSFVLLLLGAGKGAVVPHVGWYWHLVKFFDEKIGFKHRRAGSQATCS